MLGSARGRWCNPTGLLTRADSGRIIDHPQRKYSIENSERALKCSAGFPEVDGKGAGDHARKSKKLRFLCECYRRCFLHFRLSGDRAVSLRTVLRVEPAQSERLIAQ